MYSTEDANIKYITDVDMSEYFAITAKIKTSSPLVRYKRECNIKMYINCGKAEK